MTRERTNLSKQKAKQRKDSINMYRTNQQIINKVYDKESQIRDKLQNMFNGPFQILEIHNISAILLDLKTNE